MKHLQSPDGHWAAEYGGPLFLVSEHPTYVSLLPLLTAAFHYLADSGHDHHFIRHKYAYTRRMED